MYIKAFILYLLSWIASAATYHHQQPQMINDKQSSSVIFPLSGNVYPEGPLTVSTSPTETLLHVKIPYVPLHGPGIIILVKTPEEQCDYEVEYADHGSSLGVLVKDSFPLKFSNDGYDQEVIDAGHVPYTDGVLGLGIGKSSILAQLRDMGLTRNVITMNFLLSPYFIFRKYYSLGSADLRLGGQAANIKGLQIVFDSGSTYSYFSSQAYNDLVSLMRNNLNSKQLKDAVEDRSLPVCWKGAQPFKSIRDAISYFKPLVLSFKNVEFQVQPEAYLIVTVHGNVCLGILDGGEVGLGNLNVIGDISMQDKMVIYDNERQQIGWAQANCNSLPKSRQ
ncbi:UNVERIFIED_CONTAM: Aspartyl protease APCB1 [Sesamum radiatum]|uniref:Aspartyl protease APCB1 n=1 Tax=Sesamum radiatum TaxID=300843 RepID=A0AAW2SHK6_SESRA